VVVSEWLVVTRRNQRSLGYREIWQDCAQQERIWNLTASDIEAIHEHRASVNVIEMMETRTKLRDGKPQAASLVSTRQYSVSHGYQPHTHSPRNASKEQQVQGQLVHALIV
jgi:hypothetical protein